MSTSKQAADSSQRDSKKPTGVPDGENGLLYEEQNAAPAVSGGLLDDARLHPAQRRSAAAQLAPVLGNKQFQRMVQRDALVQRDGEPGLRLTTGEIIRDWSVAVTKLTELYTGVGMGVAWRRHQGVEQWWRQAQHDDPAPIWQSVLIDVVGFAAAASVAGYGAVLTARIVTQTATATLRASVAAAIDAGKNVAKSSASAAMGAALSAGGTDGRDVYLEAMKETINRSAEAESNTLAANMSGIASLPDDQRWTQLQTLYDGIVNTRQQAQAEQYSATVEGWMSASAQADTGVDFQIGNMTLMGMYRTSRLTLREMQGIKADLQVNSSLSRIRPEFHASLAAALGANWQTLPLTRVTDAEMLAGRAQIMLSPTSTTGTLELHLNTPADGGDPSVDSAEIESETGINDSTRSYFLQSGKKVEDFRVPKLLVGSSWSVAYDEQNNSGIRGDGIWLAQYGARKMNQWQPGQAWNFDAATIANYRVAATAFLRHHLMTRTLRELGVTSIDS